MTLILYARKRARACRRCRETGERNCAAVKLDLEPCVGTCRGKDVPLVGAETLQQREYLTRHLRPKSRQRPGETFRLPYRASRPRRCRLADKKKEIRKCRASIPCPHGRCCAGYLETLTEPRLHEFAQHHGPEGAGNFWELGALLQVGERPNPGRLDDREQKARSARRSPASK